VTGIATAAIVSVTLSRVSIDDVEPGIPRTPMRLLRGVIYVPVLLFEIVKANIEVARVILDPRLPIEPTMNRMRVIVGSGLPLMTLANSITLTPGTLTVRARDSDLYVHSLIPSARDGLFDGSRALDAIRLLRAGVCAAPDAPRARRLRDLTRAGRDRGDADRRR